MSSALVHITRDGEPVGAWPLFMLPRLVDNGTVTLYDGAFIEGMSEIALVQDFLPHAATAEVRVVNFPPPELPRSLNDLPSGQIFRLVFKIILAVILASPLVIAFLFLVVASLGSFFGSIFQAAAP